MTAVLGLDDPIGRTETGHEVWGGMPVELEACELLYSLVRYAKPDLIVESGTGSGRSTFAMLQGCRENLCGRIVTFEPVEEFYESSSLKFSKIGAVDVRQGYSRDSGLEPDFVFVDTGGGEEYRNPEIEHWLTHEKRPLVVVHDGNRNYEALQFGEGVNIPGWDGVWIGRGRD